MCLSQSLHLKMFWEEEKKFGDVKDIAIDSCISSNSLPDLLNLPYTLQELWGGNRKLIEYFCRDDVLTNLANTALRPNIDESKPFKDHYKLSSACSEILTVRNNNEITESFLKTLELLSSCDFVSNCVANMRMGAISELLQNIVWIPELAEDFVKVKQWYVDQRLCEKLIDLLEPSVPVCVHENVMELYCSLVRNTREQMYALEIKSDVLNDKLQSNNSVENLVEKMLTRSDEGKVFPSVTRNICEILISLLSSNHILFRPSHTLYKEFNAEIPWVGGNPLSGSDGNIREALKESSSVVWCPDANRVVEKIVASRISEVLQIVIDELECGTNVEDENWWYLLRLVIELCDTNHMDTHVILENQFKKCAADKLFSVVWRHPRCSILHGLLQRIVSFILYSSMESQSPLIAYLFRTLELPRLLRFGIQPRCSLPKIDLQSLRTYHIHLILAIEQARKNSPNSIGLQNLVRECPFWDEMMTNADNWLSWNLPDPEVINVRPSSQHACVEDAMDDVEYQILLPHHNVLEEFRNASVSLPLTDVFDTALGELQVSSETKGFAIHSTRVCKVDVNLEENDVDESSFEALCAMRDCSIISDWPMQNGDQSYDWPGISKEKKCAGSSTFHVQRGPESTKNNGAGTNDWPRLPQDSSTPKKDLVDDGWADFSCMPTSLTSDDYNNWSGGEEKDDHMLSNTDGVGTINPVVTGFASVVANAVVDERTARESEC
ncbi:SIT4 phosphatase-associated protein [Dictyocaulus viviparus]|uniref:SIT4 phosphatase-associated protein n=1 Tax=Dictyocaulus viviparus TaxID=29172 RepID=A0A0D8XEG9_DICVI|nr:SIT4 phosphatase-associated protein [Dictyocaulus viviparus]